MRFRILDEGGKQTLQGLDEFNAWHDVPIIKPDANPKPREFFVIENQDYGEVYACRRDDLTGLRDILIKDGTIRRLGRNGCKVYKVVEVGEN